jgi:hypothetical protein
MHAQRSGSPPPPPQVFDLMGFAPSHTNKINIHIGALHGSKQRSLARFAGALDRLSSACRARLTGAQSRVGGGVARC